MSIAIHTLGLNLGHPDWNELVLGSDDKTGRATAALTLAERLEAWHLSFGTGASRAEDGRSEAAFTRDALHKIVKDEDRLRALEIDLSSDGKIERLLDNARIDTQSQNTAEEIRGTLTYFHNIVDLLIFVTDGTHATRARNVLSQVRRELKIPNMHLMTAVFDADSDFGGGPQNVTVIEPPANPGDPQLELLPNLRRPALAKRMFRVPAESQADFAENLNKLLAMYGA